MKLSENFLKCYQYFNVFDMKEEIKKLSDKERYLLIICTLDNHDDEEPMVINNYRPYQKELNEILKLHEGEELNNPIIESLATELGDKHLPISGIDLPKTYTKEEARDIKLNNILEK